MRRWFWYWGPPILQMLLIFWVQGWQTLHLPSTGPGAGGDKNAHIVTYAVLAALLTRAASQGQWSRISRSVLLRAWVSTMAYGASDELHQRFVPGRSASVGDWIADAAGATVAVLAVACVASVRRLRGREV